MEAPTNQDVLRQRFHALEVATSSRLSSLNTRIKEERKQKFPCDEKLKYLKDKRAEIFTQLNLIRECLKVTDLSDASYRQIQDAYMSFVAVW